MRCDIVMKHHHRPLGFFNPLDRLDDDDKLSYHFEYIVSLPRVLPLGQHNGHVPWNGSIILCNCK